MWELTPTITKLQFQFIEHLELALVNIKKV